MKSIKCKAGHYGCTNPYPKHYSGEELHKLAEIERAKLHKENMPAKSPREIIETWEEITSPVCGTCSLKGIRTEYCEHFYATLRSSLISLLEYVEGEMPQKITIENDSGHDCYEQNCGYCDAMFRNSVTDEMLAKIREIKNSI